MYYRALLNRVSWLEPERQDVPLRPDDLPTLAVSDWATKTDSDFSVYKIDDADRENMAKKVALRFYGENPTKNVSFGLLPLDDEFVSRFPKIVDDDPVFGTVHANIKDTKYSDFVKCVNYTAQNVTRCLVFRRIDLKNMFIAMNEQERRDYAKEISQGNPGKEADILGKIKKAFLKASKVE